MRHGRLRQGRFPPSSGPRRRLRFDAGRKAPFPVQLSGEIWAEPRCLAARLRADLPQQPQ